MVAVASSRSASGVAVRGRDVWLYATLSVVVLGALARLLVGGIGVGARSAVVLSLLLAIAAWLACRLLRLSSRTTLAAVAVLMVLVAFGALPVRNAPIYDEREALFRTDQEVMRTISVPADAGGAPVALNVVAEAVYPNGQAQPTFGLAAMIGQTRLAWSCVFSRGVTTYTLQLPPSILARQSNLDVHLRVTGTPSREADYLLVYSSAPRGGALISLAAPTTDVTNCTLA